MGKNTDPESGWALSRRKISLVSERGRMGLLPRGSRAGSWPGEEGDPMAPSGN